MKLLNNLSDKFLVRKAESGNADAYGKLYMKYLDEIYRFIYFRVHNNRPEAEDLTETVFLKAWNALRNGKFNNDNFRAWVFQIARNTVIDSFRQNKKTVSLEENSTATTSVEQEFFADRQKKELLSALSQLPEDQKNVLILKYIEGLKNEEVSKTLDKTNEAVRSLSYRALKNLKAKIKDN